MKHAFLKYPNFIHNTFIFISKAKHLTFLAKKALSRLKIGNLVQLVDWVDSTPSTNVNALTFQNGVGVGVHVPVFVKALGCFFFNFA